MSARPPRQPDRLSPPNGQPVRRGGLAPDAGCITLPDGDCIGTDCMHTQPAPAGGADERQQGAAR